MCAVLFVRKFFLVCCFPKCFDFAQLYQHFGRNYRVTLLCSVSVSTFVFCSWEIAIFIWTNNLFHWVCSLPPFSPLPRQLSKFLRLPRVTDSAAHLLIITAKIDEYGTRSTVHRCEISSLKPSFISSRALLTTRAWAVVKHFLWMRFD